PLDDGKVYEALDQADTMGVFQVESRAQMQMLPRLRPRCFDDLVVEVAIIRPGPIQGNMVHPYLRRRQGLEPVTYPHPSLEPVLQETLGVVLFQEQVLRVAMAVAGFSGGQADRLRRTMSRQRSREEMNRLREVFVQGAVTRGVDEETARVIFAQLEGFATYGFCKSHAAAFALLAYQTMWLKLYHPLEFYCALLNHQPMGFYAPAVIVGDARRHGIAVQPPDLNLSQENCTIEQNSIRLGLRYVKGVGPAARQRLLALRASQPYADLRDLCYRTRLPRDVIQNLIRGGALDSIDSNRRRLLWQLKSLQYTPDTLPVDSTPEPIPLPPLTEAETIAWHIELLSLHPGEHLLHLYREHLSAAGIQPAARLKHHRDGAIIQVAGQVVVRQKPPTAKGHLFLTLEDETGLVNLIVRPHLYEQKREILRHAPFLHAVGRLQKEGEALSILVFSIELLELPPLTP
ncbi:MAG: error-prone DNA polymerase, partial [Caldilineae bacterium]